MRYRDLAQRLRELGCSALREAKGSHRVWYTPEAGLVTSIPDWGSNDLAPGTVHAILRELGISRQEFGPIT